MIMKKIAILASGNGSNAENIINYFKNKLEIIVASNKKDAYVLERSKNLNVPYFTFTKDELFNTTIVLDKLKEFGVTHIVLAGFLLLIPENLIENFNIINIHPGLLPAYGGKGMFGKYVHESVIKNGEKYSGITIHKVNSKYDEGEIIFQAICETENDIEILEKNIHELEYKYYPIVIENWLNSK